MLNYSFVKTPEELKASYVVDLSLASEFYQQEKIQAYWNIDEATARRVLPPHINPWMPQGKPIMLSYIAFFGRPKYKYPYTEAALFMLTECNGVVGAYTFSMPLDSSDQAMDAGREFFGYPKKQAFVKLERRGDRVLGYVERNDVRIFSIDTVIGEPLNNPTVGPEVLGPETDGVEDGFVIILKYDFDCVPEGNKGAFRNFRIQAQNNVLTFKDKHYARINKMDFEASEDDPWIELAPKSEEDILGAFYCKYENKMKTSKNLYMYDDSEYNDVLPYAFCAWDTSMLGKEHSSHRTENFYKR